MLNHHGLLLSHHPTMTPATLGEPHRDAMAILFSVAPDEQRKFFEMFSHVAVNNNDNDGLFIMYNNG